MLDEIVMTKEQEVAAAKQQLPLDDLKARVSQYLPSRNFRKALRHDGRVALIAELKRKSPSQGMLRERFDPVSLAQTLQEAGASALSILTDELYFGGHLDFLRDAKQFTELPVLRKDFIIDPYQVYEAALYEADAVLLIVRLLTEERLIECLQVTDRLGMEALVEVHSIHDLSVALRSGAHIIGINHRDLRTFELDPHLAEQLVPQIPAGKLIVGESGVKTADDVERLQRLGVHALLIGETLMRAPEPAAKVRELFDAAWKQKA
jgi:indole-3-glycerol phosphate synthase